MFNEVTNNVAIDSFTISCYLESISGPLDRVEYRYNKHMFNTSHILAAFTSRLVPDEMLIRSSSTRYWTPITSNMFSTSKRLIVEFSDPASLLET